ncbi:Pentatricopeptide repeat-containing protein [Zostera marina]|uniref:Pentatricopeptide repeat-containing protein n=1 Tax=Zostera marina TaxID=29655 RepID=A0A0K9Q478_ZOSMR|nr:Pentatricopeptide repeat-containing protein [Zostera marina]
MKSRRVSGSFSIQQWRNCTVPNRYALPQILKSCGGFLSGKSVHGYVLKAPKEVHLDVYIGAALVGMYAKFGDMNCALRVFRMFPNPDVGVWTSVINGYLRNCDAYGAVSFFRQMVTERGMRPNAITLTCLVSAVTNLRNLRAGMCCHGFIVRKKLDWEVTLANSILNMYSKMGCLTTAQKLFDVIPKRDMITWSSMVGCLVRNGKPNDALEVYKTMMMEIHKPNHITVTSALQACSLICDLEEGRSIHRFCAKQGLTSKLTVSTALIDMYMKCGNFELALDVFMKMGSKDEVAWTALISGFSLSGFPSEALEAFVAMLSAGTKPDAITMVKVVHACSQTGILRQALCFHGLIIRIGLDIQVFVGAALVDLYSKCGRLDCSIQVFESIKDRDVVVWTSMINGYAFHGLGVHAMSAFIRMIESSVKPNSLTSLAILTACSHSGLVEDGKQVFKNMICKYGIVPNSEHYSALVDLLGRAGSLDEAIQVIKQMPKAAANPHVWCALLAGCRVHGDMKIGELAATNLLKLDETHSGYHNLLSNMYAMDRNWEGAAEVKKHCLHKVQGCSWIEINEGVFSFQSCDRSHREWKKIQQSLWDLHLHLQTNINV